MRLPSPQMMILRCAATLWLSAVIGQAGFAAAGIGRDHSWFGAHEVGAVIALAIAVVSGVLYVALRRHGGAVTTGLALLGVVATLAQYALGESGVIDVHVFLGVLLAMIVTALTSWTYRHDDGRGDARVE